MVCSRLPEQPDSSRQLIMIVRRTRLPRKSIFNVFMGPAFEKNSRNSVLLYPKLPEFGIVILHLTHVTLHITFVS